LDFLGIKAFSKNRNSAMLGIGCLFFHSVLDVGCSMMDVHLH
jgi:hypothetical protein